MGLFVVASFMLAGFVVSLREPPEPSWRTGYSVPPADVQAAAVLAARKAAGWHVREVSDYKVGHLLVIACTAMYEGRTVVQATAIAQVKLLDYDVPADAPEHLPGAIEEGVGVQCPEA